jgi:hypothetical protein
LAVVGAASLALLLDVPFMLALVLLRCGNSLRNGAGPYDQSDQRYPDSPSHLSPLPITVLKRCGPQSCIIVFQQ